MIKAIIILETRRKTKKGYPVKIRVYHEGKYKYLPLNIFQQGPELEMSLGLKKRDYELEEQVQYCNEHNLNLADTLNIIKYGISPDDEIYRLEKKLTKLRSVSTTTLNEFTDHLIQERKVVGKSVSHFIQVQNQINQFVGGKEVNINDIDYEFLNSFIIYKKKLGTGNHGISFYLRSLRTIYREAQRRKSLNIKEDNPFQGLIHSGRRKEVLEITPRELSKLLGEIPYKLSTRPSHQSKMRRTADLFILQFLIGGHDYIDLAHLTWKNIKGDRIIFQRFKNRNHPAGGPTINNKLNTTAKRIIQSYGDKESQRIFSFMPVNDRYQHHRSNYNRSLKVIGNLIGLETKLTSKSPRYIFRTYAGNLSLNNLAIMQIQGHTPKGVSFGYQKDLPSTMIDETLKRVNKLLLDCIRRS